MGVEGKEEEVLFTECKESVEDVFGWKIIIFLPQSTAWKIFIMITVSISFVITTTKVFYLKTVKIFYILEVFCDSVYFVDVLGATLHFIMDNVRKLRHGERRPFILLLVDIISLIPLNLLFEYLIYRKGEKLNKFTLILRANVILRIYQVIKTFSDIKKTVCSLQIYYFLTFAEIFTYGALLTHLFGCFIIKYFNEKRKKGCLKNFGLCIAENDLLTFALLDHNYIIPSSDFPLWNYKSLVITEFLLGFFFTYGFITPLIIYINLALLKEFFEYSSKRKQLRLLVENMIDEKDLKKKITNYFHYVWTYGKSDNLPEIINIFPLSFQKEIFCDIHWVAIKHSDFLRDLSMGCKRSLSLHMKTEFILPNTVLFQKQKLKTFFIYLESGLIQVMTDENNESSVLNLSDGTVLGETSLFYQTESKTELRTGKFSIIHTLECTDLFRVLLNYPKDMKKLTNKMKLRLKLARAVNKSKAEICLLFLHDPNYAQRMMNNIKWLKQQFRTIVKLEKGNELNALFSTEKINENKIKDQRTILPLEAQLEHTSMYISLLCINDEGEKVYNVVCVKKSFPWFLDPDSNFLTMWNYLNDAVLIVVAVLYPAFIGWYPSLPTWFRNLGTVINLIHSIDVFLKFITAVKIKGVVISKLSIVLTQKFSSLDFYIDFLAALPAHLLVNFDKKYQEPFKLNLLYSNTLLKLYKILPVLQKLTYNPKPGVYYRATLKYVLVMSFYAYLVAAILNLLGVECIFTKHFDKDWLDDSPFVKKGENYRTLMPLFLAFFMILDIPIKSLQVSEFSSLATYFCVYIVSNFLYYAWQGESIACYVLEHSNELEYRSLMEHVNNFMIQHKVGEMIKKRVMETLEFQWLYDKGNYITEKRRIFEDLSAGLRDEVDRKFLLPILQKSRLLEGEDQQFFVDLCRRAKRLAVPANSLLITFGTQAMALYVIHKGYVQVNSFILGDSHLDVSTPLVFGSGDAFPVVVAFSQLPSAITALTLTDCELITLDLEDILTIMINHNMFPDVVQALKEVDITAMSSARLGLSKIRKSLEFDEKFYGVPFKRLKCLGTILKFFFIKKGISSKNGRYFFWETIRNLITLLNLLTWPIVFGCCCKWDHKEVLIYTLLAVDGATTLVDFYLRLHVAFYNNLGIYVMHPLSTFLHYLTSSFILDFIAFVPNFHMIYLLKKKKSFTEYIITVHLLMRSFAVHRVTGLFNYSTFDYRKHLNIIKLIKYLFFGLLALHYYVNFMVYLYLQGKCKPELCFSLEKPLEPQKPYEYYFYELSLSISMLLHGQVFLKSYSIYTLLKAAILGTLSALTQAFIFSVLTLNVTSLGSNFIVYQYYFRSFVRYLSREKVDDNISAQAIKYFKFKWWKYKGVDMKKIFSSFPYTLHEDILFPLYKDTLSGTRCLSRANEAFYRALSRNVQAVNLMTSSVIIFSKQVQADIFFVHKGKCFVEDDSKILIKGAIFGDIRNKGFMKHTIKALTHVNLLRIPSKLFFLIMGNFYDTKKAFELEVADADDFLESNYFEPQQSSLIQIESLTNEEDLPEVEFETIGNNLENVIKRPYKVKKKKIVFDPNSLLMEVLNFVFFMDAYLTFIVVPVFMGVMPLTWWALGTVYCLDAVWIIKIFITSRTALINPKTGEQIFTPKVIILNYLRRFDGMVLHVLSVLPIELIVVAIYWKSTSYRHCDIMYYCFGNRLFRAFHIRYYIDSKMKELLANVYVKLLNILVFGLGLVNLFASINLLLRRGKEFNKVECHWGMQKSQLDDLINSYYFVLNHYTGGGISAGLPENRFEVIFELMIEVWALLSKGLVVTQVLMIIYVTHFTKLDHLLKLQQLEKYVTIRDVSPALFQKMQKYSCNLLINYKEGAHPSFLKEVPLFIRTNIMVNAYMHHLLTCSVFHDAEEIFLKQLVVRLERFIFFPGDYLVEKGDVDQNMYFIHNGEVKCVEIDEKYPTLERRVDLFVTGDNFGLMQGIFLSCPHMHTYRAKVLTDVLVLNYYKWKDLRAAFPKITERIYKKFRQENGSSKSQDKQS